MIVFLFVAQGGKEVGARDLSRELSGQILLQVESMGEAWYVNPSDNNRYYLGRPDDAFNVMRELGLGIKHSTLNLYLNDKFPNNLLGKIMLDVENNGEAYYVYPKDKKGYYLGRPADAFNVMRKLGLGITDSNLYKIKEQQTKKENKEGDTDNLIDLSNINNWSIFLKAPQIAGTNMYLYFDITRDGENMKVETYQKDNNTGEMKKSLLYSYSANFENKLDFYIEDGYAKYNKNYYLLIRSSWYDCPVLRVGYNSQSYYIPVEIKQGKMESILELRHEHGDNYKDNIDVDLEIKSIDTESAGCVVRGITNNSGSFYYTKSSSKFNSLNSFKCFINEDSAVQRGYIKSYDN